MTTKQKTRRATPPAEWVRSPSGTVAQVTRVTKRDAHGRRLYRLRYEEGVRGSKTWTVEELVAAAGRWLKRKPRGWGRV